MFKHKQPKVVTNNKSYIEDAVDRRHRLLFRARISFIIFVPILAIFMSIFVMNVFAIKGPSMEPTLHEGNRVIVLKYKNKWAKIRNKAYTPKRYDVVVFPEKNSKNKVIKRVIGLPGDRVVIRNNDVYVVNKANPDGIMVDKSLADIVVVNGITAGYVDETVKEGHVFVLGDNRERSIDSREFGQIEMNKIIGEQSLKIFPLW